MLFFLFNHGYWEFSGTVKVYECNFDKNLDQDLSADVVFCFWKFIFVFMSTMQDKIVGKIDRDSIVLKLPTNSSHTYGIRNRSDHFLTCKPMG